jgi:hypothetical protein
MCFPVRYGNIIQAGAYSNGGQSSGNQVGSYTSGSGANIQHYVYIGGVPMRRTPQVVFVRGYGAQRMARFVWCHSVIMSLFI